MSLRNVYPGFIASIGELYALKSLELKCGLSAEFSECLNKIPVRILLDVVFLVFRFSKASFNALTSPFLNFLKFVAILSSRSTKGCHGSFVISHMKLQRSLGTPKIFSTGATLHLGPIRLHVENWECRALKSSARCQKFGVPYRFF